MSQPDIHFFLLAIFNPKASLKEKASFSFARNFNPKASLKEKASFSFALEELPPLAADPPDQSCK
jgi:hypothetical protein